MTPQIFALVGFFAFVVIGILALGYLFFLRPAPAHDKSPLQRGSPLAIGAPDLPAFQSHLVRALHLVGEAFPFAKSEKSPIRKNLAAAGFRWTAAPQVLFGIKYATGLFLAGLAGSTVAQSESSLFAALIAAVCAAGFGFLLPDRVVEFLIRRRGERIRRALPATLDLLVLGLEAGQSLDQALLETSRATRDMHPDLSAELFRVHLESRASKGRVEAFRQLAERNRQPDLDKFVNLLIDSDRFGSSIAPALRTHAKYLRTRFRQRAQEAARKVSVKLVFPVFFLILPSVLLVTLGPALLQMQAQLQSIIGEGR